MPLQRLDYHALDAKQPKNERQYLGALGTAAIFHAAAAAYLIARHPTIGLSDNFVCCCICVYVALLSASILFVRLGNPSFAVGYTKVSSLLLIPAFPLGTALGIHGLVNVDQCI